MVDAAASLRMAREELRPARSHDRAEIAVFTGADALDAYASTAAGMVAGPAQHPIWVKAWGGNANPDCVVAVLGGRAGPACVMALEVVRKGPFRIGRFMGGRHANGNFPASDAVWAASPSPGIESLVQAIGAARADIDVLVLERLAPAIDGFRNPLLALPHRPSPNIALAADLSGGFDALLERTSGKRKRKKHRSQARKFEAAGGYRQIKAETSEEVARLLDAFFAMKQQRLRQMGVEDVFADNGVRLFFRELFTEALAVTPAPFVLDGLEVGGRLRAVTGSSRSGRRLICEFGAIADDELSGASPGDFLFFGAIREACEDGFEVYDFSVGDEPYKRQWCDIEVRQFDAVVPLTARGRGLALMLRTVGRVKAAIKGNPLVWRLAKQIRRPVAASNRED